MITPFSELMRSVREEPGGASVDVTEDWMQGRSVFGGLQSVLALRAMRTVVPSDLPLRTLQSTFMSPVPKGTMRANAHALRTGKNTVHVAAEIVDNDETLAIMTGVFGAARQSAVKLLPAQEPVAAPRPIDFKYIPGVMPSFVQHFRTVCLQGNMPFTGDTQAEQVLEVDFNDTGMATEGHVLAIADRIWPVALSHLSKPSPGSSLTWMIEFFTDRFAHLSLKGWRVDAHLIGALDGYTSQSCMIWGPNGVPVAISRQSMVIFG